MSHVPRMREDHLKFSSELARYSNEVTTTYKETPRSDAENKALSDLSFRGLQGCDSIDILNYTLGLGSKFGTSLRTYTYSARALPIKTLSQNSRHV